MKGLFQFLVLLVFSLNSIQSQEGVIDAQARDELKLNASNLIAFTFIDVAYETLLNEESSLGVGVLVNVGDDNFLDGYRTFSLTPYNRQYFS